MRRASVLAFGLAVAIALSTGAGAQEIFPSAQRPEPRQRTVQPAERQVRPLKPQPAAPAPAVPKTERERDIAKASQPMKFTRVRSAAPGCDADCPEWIAAEGRIMPGISAFQLKRAIAGMGDKKLPIFIHSAGGAVEEAYAMGRMIRAKGLVVSVTKTDLVECAASDNACKSLAAKGVRLANPKPPLSVCASSCVFVLAGGVQRHVGPLSLVGVHQYESSVTQVQVLQKYRLVPHPRTGDLVKEVISEERVSQRTIKTRTRDEVYDKSTLYFREMGVTNAIMTPLKATPHASMHWLSPAEISDTRIATDRKAGTQVLAVMPTVVGTSVTTDLALSPPARGGSSVERDVQAALKAGNCLAGDVMAPWGPRAKRALAAFSASTGTKLDPERPTDMMVATIRSAVAARDNVCQAPVD